MLWAAALASHSCTAEQTRNIAVLQPKVFYNIANTPGIPSLLTYGPTAEVVDAGQACTIATGDDRIANSRLPNYFNTNTISADQKINYTGSVIINSAKLPSSVLNLMLPRAP